MARTQEELLAEIDRLTTLNRGLTGQVNVLQASIIAGAIFGASRMLDWLEWDGEPPSAKIQGPLIAALERGVDLVAPGLADLVSRATRARNGSVR